MTKKEVIEKVDATITRVLKAAGSAMAAAIEVAITKLGELRDEVGKAEKIDYGMIWDKVQEANRILYTVQSGYPMVPAELIVKAEKKLSPEDFMVHAAAELEKASASLAKGDGKSALPRIAAVKASLKAWESLPDDAPVPVIAAAVEAVPVGTPAAEPAPAAAPPAVVAPVAKKDESFAWPSDMSPPLRSGKQTAAAK